MKLIALTPFLVLVLSFMGCATTTTGPAPAGNDTYVITREGGVFRTSNEPLLADALDEASTFCASMDK